MQTVLLCRDQWKRAYSVARVWTLKWVFIFSLGLLLAICLAPRCAGYAVLTHEAIIDAAWKDNIAPLLLKRFPDATPEELLQAHAYVYGGAIIQDMGYYPFGSRFFRVNQAIPLI